MKLLTLGPEGTFSNKAALNYLTRKGLDESLEDSSVEIGYCRNISEVFDSVENSGKNKEEEELLGIVPVENMLDGSVGETLDLLFNKRVKIVDEVVIPISHCLASVVEKKSINDIDKIISHPKALGQCRDFIRENHFETEEEVSTASAMKKVSELEDPNIGAIGPEIAAEKYGLKILKKGTEDNKNNVTRFFVISTAKGDYERSNKISEESKKYKTSLAIHPTIDRPGLLLDLLKSFSSRDINLTKIESRPAKKTLGEYIFYIDLEGHKSGKNVKEAIEEIDGLGEIKVLGSYKRVY